MHLPHQFTHRPRRRLRRSLALGLLLLLPLGCTKVELYSNVQEKEANEMMAILLARGITCTKVEGAEELTWTLQVHSDDFSQSVEMLGAAGYPNDRRDRMGDVFKKSGLVSSPTEDRIRYVYALSEELAETVSRIDGVVDARVHVVLPNNDPFSEQVRPSSAAVYIKHRVDIDLSASRAEIKDLVAKSIEGLNSDNIEVFMDQVVPLPAPLPSERHYARVLGVQLAPDSLLQFWLLVGGLFSAAAINLALMLWYVFRGKRAASRSKTDGPAALTPAATPA